MRLDPASSSRSTDAEQAKVVARTIAAVTDDLEALSVQHGHQPVDGVRQLLHLAGRAAHEGDGDLHAVALPRWRLTWPKSSGTPGPREDAGLRALARIRPGALEGRRVEIPVQVNGKLRGRVVVAGRCGRARRSRRPRAKTPKIAALLEGKTVRKVVVVPGKLVNFVVG